MELADIKSVLFAFLILFLRKIRPDLTSATNPPLFAEEDWPWANICAHLPLFYTWDACHSVAWQAVHRSVPGIQTGESQVAAAECVYLTAVLLGGLSICHFKRLHDIPQADGL